MPTVSSSFFSAFVMRSFFACQNNTCAPSCASDMSKARGKHDSQSRHGTKPRRHDSRTWVILAL